MLTLFPTWTKWLCPGCSRRFAIDDIEHATQSATCPACGRQANLLALMGVEQCPEVPPGTRFREDSDGFEIDFLPASHAGFKLLVLAAIFGVALWRVLKAQMASDTFHSGDAIVYGLLIAITGCTAVISMAARTTVTRERDRCSIVVGIGRLRWTRRFGWLDVMSIREVVYRGRRGSEIRFVQFELWREASTIKVTRLSAPQRSFLVAVCNRHLVLSRLAASSEAGGRT